MIDDINCKKCKKCIGKNCETWLAWFKEKWTNIRTWFKGEKIREEETE